MSYLLDVMPQCKEGKKIRRVGWPEGKHLRAISADEVTVRLDGNTVNLGSSNCLLLVDKKRRIKGTNNWTEGNVLGYVPNSDEKITCDWEVVEEAAEESAE